MVALRCSSALSYLSRMPSHLQNSLKVTPPPNSKISAYSQTTYSKFSKKRALTMGMNSSRLRVVTMALFGSMVPLSRD